MDPLLQKLADLYADLQSPPGPNRCGSCNLCCTARGLSHQRVTDLEIAYLEYHHGSQDDFRRYITREEPDRYPVCPHLSAEGCQVYAHRPFSCRIFGHYRLETTQLPSECVYQGKERVFPRQSYYTDVPGAGELRSLSRDFGLRSPHRQGANSEAGGEETQVGLNLDDPWDRALDALTRQQSCELPPEKADEGTFAVYVRAVKASAEGDHQAAYRHYCKLAQDCPLRADFKTFAGFHAFQLGQLGEAEMFWLHSLQQDPLQPMAFAFLGYLASHRQEWQMAADFFAAAAQLEPEQPLHQQRWQQALQKMGAR